MQLPPCASLLQVRTWSKAQRLWTGTLWASDRRTVSAATLRSGVRPGWRGRTASPPPTRAPGGCRGCIPGRGNTLARARQKACAHAARPSGWPWTARPGAALTTGASICRPCGGGRGAGCLVPRDRGPTPWVGHPERDGADPPGARTPCTGCWTWVAFREDACRPPQGHPAAHGPHAPAAAKIGHGKWKTSVSRRAGIGPAGRKSWVFADFVIALAIRVISAADGLVV